MPKLPHIGPSIFSTMTQLANQYGAINLSQGFPDFGVDQRLKELTAQWAKAEIHQYLPMSGYAPLLEKIAKLTLDNYQRVVDHQTEILITAGATQGIFASIQALVGKDDEVLILDPSYDCYETPVLLCNAKPVRINLAADFTPDFEAISAAINTKTRMVIINNPHNPSGRIWQQSDFERLEQLVENYPNLIVLSDEVYEYITFEKHHISVNQREKLKNRSVVVSSFGKSFHITGWKTGYLIATAHLMADIKKVHQFLIFSVNSLSQYALNDYLDQVEINGLSPFYQQKRDLLSGLLKQTKFTALPCEGSYFQVVSYSGISDENDLDFTRRLVRDFGVAAIPLSPFYADSRQTQCIRLCFAKQENTIQEAVKRLVKVT